MHMNIEFEYYLKLPTSLVLAAAIRPKQCKHTEWEHGKSLGVCSLPSYVPEILNLCLEYISFDTISNIFSVTCNVPSKWTNYEITIQQLNTTFLVRTKTIFQLMLFRIELIAHSESALNYSGRKRNAKTKRKHRNHHETSYEKLRNGIRHIWWTKSALGKRIADIHNRKALKPTNVPETR